MALLTLTGGLVTALVAYYLWRVIYNISLHPLAKFPGPWWAGASSLPEMYFDLVKGGQYFKEVEKMHARYGPMVRVTPSELSCIDPDFQEQRWGGIGTRRNKDAALQRVSMSPTAALSTVDHDLHRRRRAPLQNFFSKQSITQLEPFVQVKVDKMVEMLKSACEQGTVLATQDVYGALTTDVISHYAYGESFGFLDDDKNFKNDFLRDISGFLVASHYLKHFSVLLDIVQMIPDHVLLYLHSGMASMLEIINISKSYARKTLQSMNNNEMQKKMLSKPLTIFHALADPSLPAEERSFARLTDEGIVIITAGLETTARFLTNITAHLLSNPAILSKLRAELKTVMTTPDTCVPWTTLENLPYMSAVINEGLRCEKILMVRMGRVNPEPLKYREWTIPPNTTLTASPYLLNNNPDIFPSPETFRPERWIEARNRGENLTKYLATFSKGSRMCLGINLAYAELYLTVAAVVRNFELELVDSGVRDVIAERDFAMGFTKDYKFGINVRVKEVLTE